MLAQPHQQSIGGASDSGDPVGPGGYDAHQQPSGGHMYQQVNNYVALASDGNFAHVQQPKQQSLSTPPTIERQSSFTGLPPVRRTSTLRINVDSLMRDDKGRSHNDGKRQQPPLLDEVQQQGDDSLAAQKSPAHQQSPNNDPGYRAQLSHPGPSPDTVLHQRTASWVLQLPQRETQQLQQAPSDPQKPLQNPTVSAYQSLPSQQQVPVRQEQEFRRYQKQSRIEPQPQQQQSVVPPQLLLPKAGWNLQESHLQEPLASTRNHSSLAGLYSQQKLNSFVNTTGPTAVEGQDVAQSQRLEQQPRGQELFDPQQKQLQQQFQQQVRLQQQQQHQQHPLPWQLKQPSQQIQQQEQVPGQSYQPYQPYRPNQYQPTSQKPDHKQQQQQQGATLTNLETQEVPPTHHNFKGRMNTFENLSSSEGNTNRRASALLSGIMGKMRGKDKEKTDNSITAAAVPAPGPQHSSSSISGAGKEPSSASGWPQHAQTGNGQSHSLPFQQRMTLSGPAAPARDAAVSHSAWASAASKTISLPQQRQKPFQPPNSQPAPIPTVLSIKTQPSQPSVGRLNSQNPPKDSTTGVSMSDTGNASTLPGTVSPAITACSYGNPLLRETSAPQSITPQSGPVSDASTGVATSTPASVSPLDRMSMEAASPSLVGMTSASRGHPYPVLSPPVSGKVTRKPVPSRALPLQQSIKPAPPVQSASESLTSNNISAPASPDQHQITPSPQRPPVIVYTKERPSSTVSSLTVHGAADDGTNQPSVTVSTPVGHSYRSSLTVSMVSDHFTVGSSGAIVSPAPPLKGQDQRVTTLPFLGQGGAAPEQRGSQNDTYHKQLSQTPANDVKGAKVLDHRRRLAKSGHEDPSTQDHTSRTEKEKVRAKNFFGRFLKRSSRGGDYALDSTGGAADPEGPPPGGPQYPPGQAPPSPRRRFASHDENNLDGRQPGGPLRSSVQLERPTQPAYARTEQLSAQRQQQPNDGNGPWQKPATIPHPPVRMLQQQRVSQFPRQMLVSSNSTPSNINNGAVVPTNTRIQALQRQVSPIKVQQQQQVQSFPRRQYFTDSSLQDYATEQGGGSITPSDHLGLEKQQPDQFQQPQRAQQWKAADGQPQGFSQQNQGPTRRQAQTQPNAAVQADVISPLNQTRQPMPPTQALSLNPFGSASQADGVIHHQQHPMLPSLPFSPSVSSNSPPGEESVLADAVPASLYPTPHPLPLVQQQQQQEIVGSGMEPTAAYAALSENSFSVAQSALSEASVSSLHASPQPGQAQLSKAAQQVAFSHASSHENSPTMGGPDSRVTPTSSGTSPAVANVLTTPLANVPTEGARIYQQTLVQSIQPDSAAVPVLNEVDESPSASSVAMATQKAQVAPEDSLEDSAAVTMPTAHGARPLALDSRVVSSAAGATSPIAQLGPLEPSIDDITPPSPMDDMDFTEYGFPGGGKLSATGGLPLPYVSNGKPLEESQANGNVLGENNTVMRQKTIRPTPAQEYEDHKRRQMLKDLEEKIPVLIPEPDRNLAARKQKENEEPAMSATSYPGQEWNPYGEFYYEDDD
ncbi:hypothetical protein SEPCBS57363_004970 [Sporothrix epigloea]|uniref:Uncharacterized protein n=1 Tax=Sporothrix epigloea TaxID=1892477 RepID=A0ABP0DV95_9PEZI